MKLRLTSVRAIIAVLGVGGLALAQDGLIVDPWKHAVSALFPTAAKAPVQVAGRTGAATINNDPHAANPAVVPVGPPLRDGVLDPWAAMTVGPDAPTDLVVDPWVQIPAGTIGHRQPGKRASAADWAREIREIVDPWAKGPVAVAARDPLIVDPWAR